MHLHCGSVIPEIAEGKAVGRKGQDVPEKSEEGMGARSKAEGKEGEPRRNRKSCISGLSRMGLQKH